MQETFGPSIQCVAFDFDGTLADTTSAIVMTAQGTLRDLGLAGTTAENLLPLIGLPLAELFRGVGVPVDSIDSCARRYRELFPRHAGGVRLFPAVRDCLEALRQRGLQLAIVSSRSRASLLTLLAQLDIEHYFCVVLGAEDATTQKPAPDLLLALSRQLALPPSAMLVVGDTTYDIEMGQRAGAQTCAVTYGNHDGARLEQSQPHHRLESLSELGALING